MTDTNMIRTTSAGLTLCAGLLWMMTQGLSQKPADTESVRLIESIQGPALYGAYCAVCHGKDGKGGGPMAKSLKSNTPDLTRIAVRNGGNFPLTRIQGFISGEEQLPGGHGTREMPVWGPIFSQVAWDQDLGRIRVYNLAKYIEGLQASKKK
jgi:mono/diheme cytochrome c family protein